MTNKVNIKTLWKLNKTKNQPFLCDTSFFDSYRFLGTYHYNYEKIDRKIMLDNGYKFPVWNLDDCEDEEEVLEQLRNDFMTNIIENSIALQQLDTILNTNYDVDKNYKMTNTTSSTNGGSDTTSNSIGARQKTSQFGEVTNTDSFGTKSKSESLGEEKKTNSYGQQKQSVSYGEQSSSSTLGSKETTNADKVAAFNSSSYTNKEQKTKNEGQQSNSSKANAYSDSSTADAHTDTETNAARTNTINEQAYNDTHTEGTHTNTYSDAAAQDTTTNTYGKTNSSTSTREGTNEYVADLLKKHENYWKNFDFYKIFFDVISQDLLTYADDGEEIF